MSQARPLQVNIATCESDHPGFIAGDDEALTHQLADRDIHAVSVPWTDRTHDWAAADATIIRTTWDYTDRLPEFLDWIERTEQRTPLFNDSAVARINLNKTYLKQLGDDAVPTLWIEPDANDAAINDALHHAAGGGWEHIAIKPTVGAGASGLLMTTTDDRPTALTHTRSLLNPNTHSPDTNVGAMIQPRLDTLRSRGELSIVLVDGTITHAVRKVPALGDYRCQIEFGGTYTLEEPAREHVALTRRAAALWQHLPRPPLYARVDLVDVPDADNEQTKPAAIEVELVEPELFFPMAPHAGHAIGDALRERLAAPDPQPAR